jgi:hypothetical protein
MVQGEDGILRKLRSKIAKVLMQMIMQDGGTSNQDIAQVRYDGRGMEPSLALAGIMSR